MGLDNGLAITPPMGHRTWNQFGIAVNQTLMEQIFGALADRSRSVDGAPKSLLDLGYSHAGIDDGWQRCGSGPGGEGFHDAQGRPIWNAEAFPDVPAMTRRAAAAGIVAGTYANNCHCADHTCGDAKCYAGEVNNTLALGFGSLKVDGCGPLGNVSDFAARLNASGTPVLIENCHNGRPTRDAATGAVRCDMHLFRTSADIRPTFGSVLANLLTVDEPNRQGLTGPGCWAYPE